MQRQQYSTTSTLVSCVWIVCVLGLLEESTLGHVAVLRCRLSTSPPLLRLGVGGATATSLTFC